MEKISKVIKIDLSIERMPEIFLKELNAWWPGEYTWSQDRLEEIKVDAQKGGFCTEIGPYGFRCDWGRVTELSADTIEIKWQIGPQRQPVPDPEKASDLRISFVPDDGSTTLYFEHYNFERHGQGWEEYMAMMNSEQGWDYILKRFKKYSEERAGGK